MTNKKEDINVQMIPTSKLQISEFNVRKERDSEAIAELSKSIEQEGILQPLLVRPENQHYGIIIGSRRFTAAKKANLRQIPVIIKDLEDQESLIMSLVENLQRNDLEPKETTHALNTLNETISTRDLAEKIGKSNAYVSQMVTVVKLLNKLDQVGVTTKMYPKDSEKAQKTAIGLYHAVEVAQAFNSPNLKEVLKNEPDKDLEVAKAVINVPMKTTLQVLKQYKKHPDADIEQLVQLAEEGHFDHDDDDDNDIGDYRGSIGGIDKSFYIRRINFHTNYLSYYLSNIRDMPEPTDDVQVDFIMKSREHLKMLMSELQPVERKGVYTRLNYLSGLIAEAMDEIEKVNKQ